MHTLLVEIQNSLQRVAKSSKILYALTLHSTIPFLGIYPKIKWQKQKKKKLMQEGFIEGTICNKNEIKQKILETTQMSMKQE